MQQACWPMGGRPAGRQRLDLALQPDEGTLIHLIDNAVRRSPGRTPPRLSPRREGTQAGMGADGAVPSPPEGLRQRLDHGLPRRNLPIRCNCIGLGRLDLAIAHRVAGRQGGRQRQMSAPQGGMLPCLALPLAA